jgi:steroid delta-isomerase-like uncharacterized protein
MSVLAHNQRLILRYFEEAWNQGLVEVLDELIDANYINHNPGLPDPVPGPEGLKPIIKAIRQGIPDVHFTIHDMVVSGDKVAVRSAMTGTHLGDLFGIPPSGNRLAVAQMQIEHIVNGKIVAHWRQSDDLSLLRQLGVIPKNELS